jgi:hypothetical protein
MKTLTVTDGRARLGYWLKRAIKGDDIGFVMDGLVEDLGRWRRARRLMLGLPLRTQSLKNLGLA